MSSGWFSSSPSQNASALRTIALYGSPDALPLAILQPNEETANQQALPEPILWRMPQGLLLLTIAAGAVMVIPMVVLVLFGIGDKLVPDIFAPLITTSDFFTFFFAACALLALPLAVGSYMIFRRPSGVSVDESGVTSHRMIGAQQHMRWDEMRLLLIGFPDNTKSPVAQFYLFRIYSAQGTTISWRYPGPTSHGAGDDFRPYRMTSEEARRRAMALLNVIYARTGLRLRTLDPRLASRANAPSIAAPASQTQYGATQPGQTQATAASSARGIRAPSAPTRSQRAIVIRTGWNTLAFILVGVVVTIPPLLVFFSSGAISPAIIAIIAALALLGYLALLIAAARGLSRDQNIRPDWTGNPQANTQPEQVYTFTTGYHRSTQLLCLFGALLLLPMALPLAQIVIGISAVGATPDYSTGDLIAAVFTTAALLYSLVGALIALSGRLSLFRADTEGISLIEGKQVSTIRWDEVERIERYAPLKEIALDAQGGFYTLFGSGSIAQIIWPIGGIAGAWPYGSLPGAEALTADGLVALAMRRSGKPLGITYKQSA